MSRFNKEISVRGHGRKHLEIKSAYPLTEAKSGRYTLDIWLFVPASLRIGAQKTGPQQFLSNTKCLTRFGSSHMSLSALVDPECEVSPLARIQKEISDAAMPGDIRLKKVIYELRSLVNIYQSQTAEIEHVVREHLSAKGLNLRKEIFSQNLQEIRNFLGLWRGMYSLFLKPGISERLRSAYTWADEAISFNTERSFAELSDVPYFAGDIIKIMDEEMALPARPPERYYHVNLVTSLKEKNSRQYSYSRHRLIISQNGFERMERVRSI